MSKKDRMLEYITSCVDWFMTTSASVEVIPYYELSEQVFIRVKHYFASDAQYSDVVCLISTSVFEVGKSGILFTTDYVYSKAWGGILTGTYKNWIFLSFGAKFDIINEFDEDRMKELMSDLADIAIEEDELQRKNEKTVSSIEKIGKSIGVVALGSMALVDIISSIGDKIVSKNNETLAKEIASLEKDTDEDTRNIMNIYKEFIPVVKEFAEIVVDADEESPDACVLVIKKINEILLNLYYQASVYVNISIDNFDEYFDFEEWITFWALMFYDADQFRETYSLEILHEMPEYWDVIINMVDSFLEDEDWEEPFSDILFSFAATALDNGNKSLELLLNSETIIEWGEEEKFMRNLIESSKCAIIKLQDALDRATDYFIKLIDEEE